MQGLILPGLLFVLALGLLLLEVLTATGGLAIVAGLVYVGSVALAFYSAGAQNGTLFLLVTLLGGGGLVAALVRWMPYSPIGKLLFIRPRPLPPGSSAGPSLKDLIGHTGQSQCEMLPGGVVLIEGQKFDAVSEGPAIGSRQPVRVIAVRGRSLVVRPIDAHEVAQPAAGSSEQPLDQVIPDPFQEPLA